MNGSTFKVFSIGDEKKSIALFRIYPKEPNVSGRKSGNGLVQSPFAASVDVDGTIALCVRNGDEVPPMNRKTIDCFGGMSGDLLTFKELKINHEYNTMSSPQM